MKAGWQVKPLGDVTVVDWGNTNLTKKAFVEGGAFLGVSAAGCDGRMAHAEHKRQTPVLSAIGANCGRMFLPDEDFTAIKNTITITPLENALDRVFLFYLLTMVDLPQRGAGQPFISKGDIQKFEVSVPPLVEQKQIVEVLDAAFEGLTRAKENAEANLQNARELFEAGLVSVFSTIERNSDQKLLKEIALDFGRGKSKHRPRNAPFLYGGPYPFVQTGDVRNSEHLITEFKQSYSAEGLAQSKLWPANTLCITIAANIAETAILSFDACFPDSIIGVVPDPKLTSSRYLEYLLQFFQKRLKARGEGAAQHNINLATFETEYFPFPSLSEQEAAIEALDKAAAAVQLTEAHYRTKLTDLADLRQSLLQKAFAGELT